MTRPHSNDTPQSFPESQPKPEYIVDEYTLGEIERLLNMPEHAWDDSDYDAQNLALKLIRSRPASSSTQEICETCEWMIRADEREKHDAAIRNATLDEVMQKLDHRFNDTDHGRRVIETCKEVIKSQRQSTGAQQPKDGERG